MDANRDGIPDVLQMSDSQLMTRRLLNTAKAVDPLEVRDAAGDLTMTFFAVIATLKMKFAEVCV